MAGADVILVPSRFEPCGLTQLYGLRYGALPLAHRVGGLADTVVDATAQNLEAGRATGFVFGEFTAQALQGALRRAFELHARPDAWAKVFSERPCSSASTGARRPTGMSRCIVPSSPTRARRAPHACRFIIARP